MKQMNEILMKQVAEKYEAIPPDFIWENIEIALNENKKRRYFFLLLSAGLTLACFSAFLFFRGINDNENTHKGFVPQNTLAGTAILKNEPIRDENTLLIQQNEVEKKNKTVFSKKNSISNQTENLIEDNPNTLEENFEAENINQDDISGDNKSKELISIKSVPKTFSVIKYPVFRLNYKDRIKCPDFSESNSKMFAELGFLGGYHIKTIGNGSNKALADIRNKTESEWYTWGINGAIGLNITPEFYIGIGIDWTQSKDKFNHSTEAITKMIITFDPATGVPTDTSFVTGKLINKGEIRYNFIDIPLVIGYVKKFDKWDFGAELAPVFNLSFKAKGKIFNDKMTISTIGNEPPVYKSGLGVGLKASLVIRRNISDGLSVQLKPTFKTYFGDINDGNYALPMRYNLLGINLGVRKDF